MTSENECLGSIGQIPNFKTCGKNEPLKLYAKCKPCIRLSYDFSVRGACFTFLLVFIVAVCDILNAYLIF